MIPYGRHHIAADDVEAVVDVLKNHFLTQGHKVPEFESALCEYTGSAFAVAVNSGTSGLHIACLAAGVGAGDIVWTSPISFVASANCALYCGAQVDFVDIEPNSRNICVEALSDKLHQAKLQRKLPKAIIVVHFAGESCDMQKIHQLADEFGFFIIEDAAHALGGEYCGSKIGCCQFSDMAVLSFHPVKSITSAEGGVVLTNSAKLAKSLRQFASHGVTKDKTDMSMSNPSDWYYEQQVLGLNYRLSDVHAALGLSQLRKLDVFIQKRRKITSKYFDQLANVPLKLPEINSLSSSAWHLFVVECEAHNRDHVFDALRRRQIGVNMHYIPIYLQPYFRDLGFAAGLCKNAEEYYSKALTIPLYPELSADDQNTVISALIEILT